MYETPAAIVLFNERVCETASVVRLKEYNGRQSLPLRLRAGINEKERSLCRYMVTAFSSDLRRE
jgi:hypothetical protein